MNILKDLPKDTCVTILPHDTVDVDSAISAILLSKLFDFYNVPNEIVIFDKSVDKWTTYFLNKLGYDLSKFFVKTENESRTLFLVDHYKTSHKGTVIGCIDHHFTSEDINYNYYLYKPSCSAAYLIFKIMQKLHMPITKQIVELVGYASFVDTCSFKSTKAVPEEKNEVLSLLRKHEFDVEEMLVDCLCLDNLEQMSLREIAFNGVKKYNYCNSVVKSSYIQISSLEISEEVISFISELAKFQKLDMWVFIVFDMINEKTMVYKITKNQVISEIYNGIKSRGKDIMPVIEKEFCKQ